MWTPLEPVFSRHGLQRRAVPDVRQKLEERRQDEIPKEKSVSGHRKLRTQG